MYKWGKPIPASRVRKWRRPRLAEYKKIKAELREARTGDRFQRQSGGLSAVAGIPAKSTIRVHPSVEEGNHPGTCVMCRCPVVSHSGLLHPGATGACRKPAKRCRGTRQLL